MQRSIVWPLILFSFASPGLASDLPRHMVTINTSGLGVSAAYERTSPEDSSQFRDFDILTGDLALNYAYTIRPQLQFGAFLSNHSEKRKYETKSGQEGEVTYDQFLWGVMALWNFSTDLKNSFYTGIIFSVLNDEEEHTGNVFNFLEDDKYSRTYEAIFGKRFSLERWGLANITYAPAASFYVQHSSKDYADDGLKDSMVLRFQLIKFDVLF